MPTRSTYSIPFALLLLFNGCAFKGSTNVSPTDKHISYMGRVGKASTGATELYWSGTSVKLAFEGTGLKAQLMDEHGNNDYNIIIDQDSVRLLQPGSQLRTYTLAENLPAGKHTVELFKRTEFDRGKTLFYGFLLPNKARLLTVPEKSRRKMEFYGNSITAGFAIDDYSGNDSPEGTHTNNYLSYAALTARHFEAQYACICKSGIGVTVSWFPYTMPDLYDRLDPNNPESRWNFSGYQPDVVVVNLLQNDSWLVENPTHEEFKRVFDTKKPSEEYLVKAYQTFIQHIRRRYPKADIICMLGNMDITKEGSPWPGYVAQAVAPLHDSKVHTLVVPYKNTPGHPRVEEQQAMAQTLIRFINQNIDW